MLQELECFVRCKGLFVLSFASNLSSFRFKELSKVKIGVFPLHLAYLIIKFLFLLSCPFVKKSTKLGFCGIVNDFSCQFSEILNLFKAWQIFIHVLLELSQLLS